MPVLNARRALDHIAFPHDPCRLALLLVIANAFGDEQNLSCRMDVPIQLCARIVGCHCNTRIEGAVADYQFIQPDVAGVILRRRKLSLR